MMARGLTKPVRYVLHISVTRPYITPQSQWIVFQHNAITRRHETSQSQYIAFRRHTRPTLLIAKLRKAFAVQYETEPLIRFSTQSPHRVVRDEAHTLQYKTKPSINISAQDNAIARRRCTSQGQFQADDNSVIQYHRSTSRRLQPIASLSL